MSSCVVVVYVKQMPKSELKTQWKLFWKHSGNYKWH